MTKGKYEVTDFKKGDAVIYTGGAGETERGIVTSTNAVTVFVDYKHGGYGPGQATTPSDLEKA